MRFALDPGGGMLRGEVLAFNNYKGCLFVEVFTDQVQNGPPINLPFTPILWSFLVQSGFPQCY